MSGETNGRCEYLPGTIGAESHCNCWHAADDAGFAGDRASAECCWCGDHEDGSGSCPGPTQGDTDYLLHRLRVARATVPKDGPTDRILAQAHDELERLHALTEGDPTSIYAEAGALRGEVDGLRAENERLREALEAIAGATTIADAVPEVRQFARDALAAASLSETGGEAEMTEVFGARHFWCPDDMVRVEREGGRYWDFWQPRPFADFVRLVREVEG